MKSASLIAFGILPQGKGNFLCKDNTCSMKISFSRKISGVENQCALYCAEKYLKMNQRISTRFQEFQMMSNENAMAVIKKSGQL